MFLRFKTKRDINGNRKYLALDTEKKVFCTYSRSMIPDGEEITATALRNIQKAAESAGFIETGAF